jgi:hypothetical protein
MQQAVPILRAAIESVRSVFSTAQWLANADAGSSVPVDRLVCSTTWRHCCVAYQECQQVIVQIPHLSNHRGKPAVAEAWFVVVTAFENLRHQARLDRPLTDLVICRCWIDRRSSIADWYRVMCVANGSPAL